MTRDILKPAIFIGLFILPFVPFLVSSSLFFPFITTKAFTFRIIVEIIFAAWIILALLDKEYRPKRSPVLYALLGFLAVIGLANIFGADPVKSFWSNAERMEGYIALLHLGAFFLVITSVFKQEHWNRWWNTTLAASGLMVAYCFFQLAGAVTINQGGVRVDGTLGNASYLAGYLLFHIFLALLMFWRNKRDVGARWMYAILILGQLFVLYHTATRGAILGLLGGLLLLAILNVRNKEDAGLKKASLGIIAGLVVLVGGFAVLKDSSFVQESPVLARFSSITGEELRSGGRAFIWPMAIEGVKERPLLGWGQENFIYVFQEHYDPEMYRLEPWFDRAHNIFLDWAIAGGILGLIAYLSLYGTLLYLVWREDISYAEKSVITSLVAAYFFHNLFVFDNLVSYTLFFALLAYVHSRAPGKTIFENVELKESRVKGVALPLLGVVLLLVLYFGNIKPIVANASLLDGLRYMQLGQPSEAIGAFKKSYGAARLGRPEIAEQIAANSVQILQSDIPIGERNDFFQFSKMVVEEQAEIFSDDARYQLIAGNFLARTGQFDEAIARFSRGKELMPEKQAIYFGLGNAYLRAGDTDAALQEFKTAYELAPDYAEAKVVYLVGAIYAGNIQAEEKMLAELSVEALLDDERIYSAYLATGQSARAIAILNAISAREPELEEGVNQRIEQIQNSSE